ncbi:MAG: tail fiber domain-containing protein [Chitinophagaceae bacterium]
MRKLLPAALFFLFVCPFAQAQNTGIGIAIPTNRLHVFAVSNPLRLEGLTSGTNTDSLLTADATGVVRRRTVASVLSGGGWGLAGNAATNINTQFIGTTDQVSLAFRTFNQRSGFIDFDSTKRNNSFGNRAMNVTITGNGNNAFGYQAMRSLSSGINNVAMGDSAGFTLTTGTDNIFLGSDAGKGVTIASQNIAIGSKVLGTDGAGSNNIGIGFRSLESEFASDNIAIGTLALNKSIVGTNSIAVGSNALTNFTGTAYAMALGVDALSALTTGNENIAYGYRAGYTLTTQLQNTLLGNFALGNIQAANAANYNTMVGHNAGGVMNGGSNNTAVGWGAGATVITSGNSTYIGYNADVAVGVTTLTNASAFGYATTVSANNQIRVGNAAVSSIGGQTGWTTVSDERVKMNVQENVPGLDFITKLRPVTYNYNLPMIDQIIKPKISTDISNTSNTTTRFSGFLAQEVLRTATEAGYDFSGVDKPQNDRSMYGLRYAEFVVPLVKAVQELNAIVASQQIKINELETLLIKKK